MLGMVVGSFTSVSLDPPLIAFFPDRSSTTWPRIAKVGRFCVNVLSDSQERVCRALSARGDDKFGAIAHQPSFSGQPRIDGVVAWIDCDIYAVHDAGDHWCVFGQVTALDIESPSNPLLFFKGSYGQFAPLAISLEDVA
ncbi:flavin reductase family protein [Sphingomonas oryzagri]